MNLNTVPTRNPQDTNSLNKKWKIRLGNGLSLISLKIAKGKEHISSPPLEWMDRKVDGWVLLVKCKIALVSQYWRRRSQSLCMGAQGLHGVLSGPCASGPALPAQPSEHPCTHDPYLQTAVTFGITERLEDKWERTLHYVKFFLLFSLPLQLS